MESMTVKLILRGLAISIATAIAMPQKVQAETPVSKAVSVDSSATVEQKDTPKKKNFAIEAGLALGLGVSTTGLGVGPAFGLDIGARFRLGPGAFAVHLRPQFQTYSKEDTLSMPCAPTGVSSPCLQSGSMGYKVNEQALDFSLRASYRFMPLEKAWAPYLGVGPKLFLLKATSTSAGLENKETQTKMGFVLFGGALINLGPGHAFLDIEYQWGGLTHKSTGESHLAGMSFVAGYRLAI